MVQPGVVVDAVGELQEQLEVVRLEVELAVGAAEVEAAVGAEVALGVLARVARALRLAAARCSTTIAPARRLASTSRGPVGELVDRVDRRARAGPATAQSSRSVCSGCSPISEHGVDRLEHRRRDAAGVHGDVQRAVRARRAARPPAAHVAGSRWCASSIDEPVRPAGARAQLGERGQQLREELGPVLERDAEQVDHDVARRIARARRAPPRRAARASARRARPRSRASA